MGTCSGQHEQFEAAVNASAIQAQESKAEAFDAHKSAIAMMQTEEQRDLYISNIASDDMRAKMAAYLARMEKKGKKTLVREGEEAKMKKENDESVARDRGSQLEAQVAALQQENLGLQMQGVAPLVSEMASAAADPAAALAALEEFSPDQVRQIHALGLHRAGAPPAATAAMAPLRAPAAPVAAPAPAQYGAATVPGGQVIIVPQGAGLGTGHVSNIAATVPHQGNMSAAGNPGAAATASYVPDEFEVTV